MKYILFIWMIIPLTIESSTSAQLNDFFDSDLTFTQTSLNKNKNLIEESEGIFKRLEDNSIIIEISTPFRENYFVDKFKINILFINLKFKFIIIELRGYVRIIKAIH